MSTINLEILNGKVVRLQTRPCGDVEVIVSENFKHGPFQHNKKSKTKNAFPKLAKNIVSCDLGGVQDTLIAVVPKHRRELVAEFLMKAT